jgi:hypothetical protein
MAKTPLLLVTDAGEAAAARATPHGPYVSIVKAKIGSAYGYTPTREDTDINGNLLATLDPITYDYVGDNTIRVQFQIPPDTGPFDFGEIGIFSTDKPPPPGDTTPVPPEDWYLFGKAVFDKPQTKYSSLGTNVGSTFTFNVLIKLKQSVAIFKILNAEYYPAILDVECWSDVVPPAQSANPEVKMLRVMEKTNLDRPSILVQNGDLLWDVVGTSYYRYIPKALNIAGLSGFPIVQASATYIQIDKKYLHDADLGIGGRMSMIQLPNGDMRSVASVQQVGNNFQFNLNVTNAGGYNNKPLTAIPAVNTLATIWRSDQSTWSLYYDSIIDPPAPPPPPPLANWGQPGLATAGDGMALSASGYVATYGLLHSPAQNTGRFLTGGDDLNNPYLPSGLYTINNVSGWPVNFPANLIGYTSCHLMQIAPERGGGDRNGSITQYLIPLGQQPGGYPVYWRTKDPNGWVPWSYFLDPNKQGMPQFPPTIMTGVNIDQLGQVWSDPGQPLTVSQRCLWVLNLQDAGGGGDCFVRADFNRTSQGRQLVGRASRYGGAGYGRWVTVSGIVNAGDTLYFQMKDWTTRTLYRYNF